MLNSNLPRESENHASTWWLWRRSSRARPGSVGAGDGSRDGGAPNLEAHDIEARDGARHLSPILRRILAVNVMALAILVGSLLYLGHYQDRIISTELEALLLQSRIIASAVAEGAIVISSDDRSLLSPLLARMMVRRLAETTETRTRLFDVDDTLLADSRSLLANKPKVQIEGLVTPPEDRPGWGTRLVSSMFDVVDSIHERHEYPLYSDDDVQFGSRYAVVQKAMQGEMATQVWRSPQGGLTLAAAVPVQHYKRVLGAVMMSRSDANIDKAITSVRLDIIKIFGITLLITVLLSIYLARTIAQPIRLLALAAEGLRHGQSQVMGLVGTAGLLNRDAIPDMTARDDEIGDLSGALRDLTTALAQRIGAIENFAADVAHEIKNPLTSLRSAVETVERVQDPAAQRKLLAVIRDDVDRLDRLITDIATASRLDAELGRDQASVIDVGHMLTTLVDFYHQPGHEDKLRADVVLAPISERIMIMGVEARLVQVLQNLIENALSFSPVEGKVTLAAIRDGGFVCITVDDQGPGIPANKLSAIFDRFYSERPRTEKFGTHSGLGLSISKQIIEAHRGRIWAENHASGGGARFILLLPAV